MQLITLADVRNYLNSLNIGEHFYIGRIPNSIEYAVGVYSRAGGGEPIKAFGNANTYGIKSVNILVHWNNNADETERKAQMLYDAINDDADAVIGGKNVAYFDFKVPEPIEVGTTNEIYERAIWLDIYYNK